MVRLRTSPLYFLGQGQHLTQQLQVPARAVRHAPASRLETHSPSCSASQVRFDTSDSFSGGEKEGFQARCIRINDLHRDTFDAGAAPVRSDGKRGAGGEIADVDGVFVVRDVETNVCGETVIKLVVGGLLRTTPKSLLRNSRHLPHQFQAEGLRQALQGGSEAFGGGIGFH